MYYAVISVGCDACPLLILRYSINLNKLIKYIHTITNSQCMQCISNIIQFIVNYDIYKQFINQFQIQHNCKDKHTNATIIILEDDLKSQPDLYHLFGVFNQIYL